MARKKSKGRGWHGEPGRHADAARGIKTGHYTIGPTDREKKLQVKLSRKTEAELIKMGDKYGFMFDESASKADMVVELATAIMEASLTGFTPGERKEMQERTLEFLAIREPTELEIQEDRHEVKLVPTKFVLDFNRAEAVGSEDLGGTTYYGGYVTVNGVKVEIHGSDRTSSHADLIRPEIEKQLGRELTDSEEIILFQRTDGARHSPFETHLPAVVEWKPATD